MLKQREEKSNLRLPDPPLVPPARVQVLLVRGRYHELHPGQGQLRQHWRDVGIVQEFRGGAVHQASLW